MSVQEGVAESEHRGHTARARRVRSDPLAGEENRFLLPERLPEDLACGLMPPGLGLTSLRGPTDAGPPVTVRETGPIIRGHDDRSRRRTDV
jgi:hypothetical protein